MTFDSEYGLRSRIDGKSRAHILASARVRVRLCVCVRARACALVCVRAGVSSQHGIAGLLTTQRLQESS